MIVDGDEALRLRLRRVGVGVVLAQPDLGCDAGVEESIRGGTVLDVAPVDDEADVGGARLQLDPGETTVFVLTEERLWCRPLDGLIDVAPQVQTPVVVEVAGGVATDLLFGRKTFSWDQRKLLRDRFRSNRC